MTTTVSTTKDFQERLYEKIRTDIGSLMTDEDIKKLVETSMERTFFTPRTKQDGYRTVEVPPRINEIIQELMAPKLEKALKEWLDENPEVVKQKLDVALAGGLASATLRALDSIMSGSFYTLQNNILSTLQQRIGS